jgi:O-antigen ligase
MSLYFFTFLPGLNNISNAIAAVFIFLAAMKMLIEKRKVIFNRFLFIYLLFIMICIISYFYAIDQMIVLIMVRSLLLYFIFVFFLINYVDSYDKLINFLNYFIYAGLFATTYLLINSEIYSMQRLGGLLGNINEIGIIIGISALFSIYFILFQKRYLYLLPAMACMGMVLATGSRVALVLTIFSSLLLLYFNNKNSFKGRIKSITLAILLLFLFYYLLFNVPYFYQIAGQRVENILKFISAEQIAEGSIIERTYMFRYGLELFKASPLIGYGVNNYRILLGKDIGVITYAHSNYIELLVGLGILGAIIYYSMYANAVICLLKSKNNLNLRYLFLTFLLSVLIIDFASVNYYSKHIYIVLAVSSIFASLKI